MIVHDVPQRIDGIANPAWLELRLGVATASQFHRIITPKTEKPSTSMRKYALELLGEWLNAESGDEGKSLFMDRGNDLEDEARRMYEYEVDADVQPVGFVTSDDGLIGCSPDGFVMERGGVEIKVPAIDTHLGYLADPDTLEAAYRCQVQATLMITGRTWWDLWSYNPEQPCVRVNCKRDLPFLAKMVDAVEQFKALYWVLQQTLSMHGCKPKARIGIYCTHKGDEGRFCFARKNLTETPLGWRCSKHLEEK